ncbi:MAG TPA: rod shape-determining protein MreD [Burkholderiales bacterium]|nr:rod shape-determining protein MreD [Burkholderiales bacterium]
MPSQAAQAQEILLPVKTSVIVLSLAIALFLNLLPWSGFGLLIRPDFVALILLYWCMHWPRKVGFGTAWGMGLLMDVADATLLGEHAFAYSLLVYLAIIVRRRALVFSPREQVWHVLSLLLISQLAILLVKVYSGAEFIGWGYFLSSVTGSLLWPALSALLAVVLRLKPEPDQV